jgi:hypothetical protein
MDNLKTNCIVTTLDVLHFDKLKNVNPYSFDAPQFGSYRADQKPINIEIHCSGTINDCLCRVSFANSIPKEEREISPVYVPVPSLGFFSINAIQYDTMIVHGFFNKAFFDEKNFDHIINDIIYKVVEAAIGREDSIHSALIEMVEVVYGFTDNGEEGINKFKLPFPT